MRLILFPKLPLFAWVIMLSVDFANLNEVNEIHNLNKKETRNFQCRLFLNPKEVLVFLKDLTSAVQLLLLRKTEIY